MNQVVEQDRPNPLAQLRKDIKSALPTFGLKNEREQERMASVLMVAVEKDPDLVFADRASLIAATRQCANHGLVPDGNEATLQVYNSKVKRNGKEEWIKKVQYQPMIRGIVNRVLRSGKVLSFWAEVVYDGEKFSIDASNGDRKPIHSPDFFARKGEIIGVYSVAKLSNGTIDCEPMSRAEIMKVRNVAKTKNAWDGWFEEKAKVAVMRRHSKRLPLSAEDMDMILNREEHDLDHPVRDVTPQEEHIPLSQRLAAAKEEASANPIDGEIMHDEEPSRDINKDAHWTASVNPQDGSSGTQAWLDGVSSHAAGKKLIDNPHEDDMEAADDWAGGWTSAEDGK